MKRDERKPASFEEILGCVLELWPPEIAVTERIASGDGGARYPALVEVHARVERQIFALSDPLVGVMDWVFYKMLHRCAASQDILRLKELDRDQIKEVFERDLYGTPELSNVRDRYTPGR